MKFLSVCSGIESAGHAWAKLGWEPVAFSEVEDFPCAVLAERFPGVVNLGDMLAYQVWPDLEFDVLVGGTPCQAFSVAGNRGSLDDDRGNLTLAFCGVAERYDPACVVWENVPGVLSTPDNAFGCFLGALCGEDSAVSPGREGWTNAGVVAGPGRTIAWRVLDAQGFVAQRRSRVFVVAARAGSRFHPADVLFETEADAKAVFGARLYTGPIFPVAPRLQGDSAEGGGPGEGTAAGVALGARDGVPDVAGTIVPLSGNGGFRTTDLDQHGAYVPDLVMQAISSKWEKQTSGPAGDEVANLVAPQARLRRLMPVECERLMGLPDGWTAIAGAKDSPRYRAIGNAMVSPVMWWIGKRIERAWVQG